MTKNKIEIIVTSTLVVILFFISKAQGEEKAAAVSAKEAEIKKLESLPWGRDPFVLASVTKAKAELKLVLNGIVWDERSPSAIINSTVVRVGDEISGNKVIEIQRDKVILNKDTAVYELNLTGQPSR